MRTAIISLLFSITLSCYAQPNNGTKALYIYQFTKMINWPTETKSGMFRIGVLGSFDAYKEISEVTMGRNVGSQNIEVMNVFSIDQLSIAPFHILFIGDDYCTTEQLQQISTKLKSKATLIITSKQNYSHTLACIGFEGTGRDFTYNFSKDCISTKGLAYSKEFISLGVAKQ